MPGVSHPSLSAPGVGASRSGDDFDRVRDLAQGAARMVTETHAGPGSQFGRRRPPGRV